MRTHGYCPCCGAKLDFGVDVEQTYGATTDCNSCGALLLSKPYGLVLFHVYLHESDKRWPKDGQGTAFLEAN